MSVDATRATWKLTKKQVTPTQKLILLALADRAGENGECWPALSRIIQDTGLDRNTIVENRQILIDKGLIELTGTLVGKTKSVPVMRLTFIHNRELSSVETPTASNLSSREMPTGSSREMPTAKQYGNAYCESKRIEPKKEPKKDLTEISNKAKSNDSNLEWKKTYLREEKEKKAKEILGPLEAQAFQQITTKVMQESIERMKNILVVANKNQ